MLDLLPPEVLASILKHLSGQDLLWVRGVNHCLFDAVAGFSHRIVFRMYVGIGAKPDSVRTLVHSKFPYKHFRIATRPTRAICDSTYSRLPDGVDIRDLQLVCSSASSMQFHLNGISESLSRSLIKAAAKNLEFLGFDTCGRCVGSDQFFQPVPGEEPLYLPKLEHFHLKKAVISDAILVRTLRTMPSLQVLSLVDVGHRRGDYPVKAALLIGLFRAFCPNMRSLDLTKTSFVNHRFMSDLYDACTGSDPTVHLDEISCNKDAVALSTWFDEITVKDVFNIAGRMSTHDLCGFRCVGDGLLVQPFESIRSLLKKGDLSYNANDVGFILREKKIERLALGGLEGCNQHFISKLNLSAMTTLHLPRLAGMTPSQWLEVIRCLSEHCGTVLTTLNLADNNITNEVVTSLFKSFPRIQRLSLAECLEVTDHGLSRMPGRLMAMEAASLTELKDLVELDLRGLPEISDLTLQFGLSHPSLEFICIRGCEQVTDEGLCALNTTAKNLVYVDVDWCPLLTAAGIARFVRDARRLKTLEAENMDEETKAAMPEPDLFAISRRRFQRSNQC